MLEILGYIRITSRNLDKNSDNNRGRVVVVFLKEKPPRHADTQVFGWTPADIGYLRPVPVNPKSTNSLHTVGLGKTPNLSLE